MGNVILMHGRQMGKSEVRRDAERFKMLVAALREQQARERAAEAKMHRFITFWTTFAFAIGLLIIVALFVAKPAHAADCARIAVTLHSYHFDRSVERNEKNFGLGGECIPETMPGRFSFGFYHNSEWGRTEYALYTYPLRYGFGLTGGLMAGYSYAPIMPVAALSYRYKVLRLMMIPPVRVGGVNQGVIGAQIVLELK